MKNLLTLIVSLSFLSGCMLERQYDIASEQSMTTNRGDYYGFFSNSDDTFVDIVGSSLRGVVGQVENIESSPTSISGLDEGDYTYVEVMMASIHGSAMVGFTFYGGITHPGVSPGHVYRFLPSSAERYKEDLHIEAIVCSGALPGEWSYDDVVNMVGIEVEELEMPEGEPPAVRINFTTTTEGDVATGHLDVVATKEE